MALYTDGFGLLAFGDFLFGKGDWAESVTHEAIPEFYRLQDKLQSNPSEPLRDFHDAVKEQLEFVLDKAGALVDLNNPLRVDESQVLRLGAGYGVAVDQNKSVRFQRSQILNALRIFLRKGQDEGYENTGIEEDLDVLVEGLWENPCESGTLQTTPPSTFTALYDRVPADLIPCDRVFTDELELLQELELGILVPASKVDSRLEPDPDICRTHKLLITLTRADVLDPSDIVVASSLNKIRAALEKAKPIHVEFETVQFETILEASLNLSAEIDINNDYTATAFLFHEYDEIPADAIPTDGGLSAELEVI